MAVGLRVKLSADEPATAAPHRNRRPYAVAAPVAPGRTGPLRVIGNILWLVLAGLWMALAYLVAGVIQCVTIIGIPFGSSRSSSPATPCGRSDASLSSAPTATRHFVLGNAVWLVLSGLVAGARTPPYRPAAVPHDHRHPLRRRLVQARRPRPCALRQGGRQGWNPAAGQRHHLPHRVSPARRCAVRNRTPRPEHSERQSRMLDPGFSLTRTYRHCGTARLASGRSTIRSVVVSHVAADAASDDGSLLVSGYERVCDNFRCHVPIDPAALVVTCVRRPPACPGRSAVSTIGRSSGSVTHGVGGRAIGVAQSWWPVLSWPYRG